MALLKLALADKLTNKDILMIKIKVGKHLPSVLVGSVLALCFQNTVAFAAGVATGAAAITRQLEEAQQYREQKESNEKSEQDIPTVDTEALPDDTASPLNSTVKFELNSVDISESDILTDEDIELITRQYLKRIITLNDLNRLLDEINDLYRLKGYLASKAYLPPQKISNGTVKINLVEGRIGTLKIEGNTSTNSDYILTRLAVSEGDLVELEQLGKRLERLNLLNDFQLGIALKPGEEIGKTTYLLTVKEPKRQESFVYTDNAGTKDVGLYRIGFNYVDRSLTGNRDLLTIGAYAAEGTSAFYTSYAFPINDFGTELRVSGNVSKIDIIDGALEVLDISGNSYSLGLELSHPFWVEQSGIVTGTLAVNKKRSSTDISSVTLFETKVNTIDVGIKWQQFSPTSVSYASIKGTLAPTNWDNETSFFKINADFSYNTVLKHNWLALFRLGGQWSDTKNLPSVEQFQMGGIYTVRGYTEGLLVGDKGYYSRIELSHAVSNDMKKILGHNARHLLFLDHGAAIAFKGNGKGTDKDDFLTSIGVGLDFNLSKDVSAYITIAKPLVHRDDGEDSGRANFSIQAQF